jgi:hypothetical protein
VRKRVNAAEVDRGELYRPGLSERQMYGRFSVNFILAG